MAENSTYTETTDSIVVEQNGVSFETLVPESVLLIPENKPGAETPVEFGIRMTNQTQKPLRFCNHRTFFPILIGANGKRLQNQGGSERARPIEESDCPLVNPGESVTFFIKGGLVWHNNKLQLKGYLEYGDLWLFLNINPGRYGFWFNYYCYPEKRRIWHANIKEIWEEIWAGQVETPLVEIYFVPITTKSPDMDGWG